MSKINHFTAKLLQKIGYKSADISKDNPWYHQIYMYFYLENKVFGWFYSKIYTNYRVFRESLERTIDFIPVIWRSKDFDYAFMWPVIQKKLEQMESVFRNGSAVNSPLVANQVRVAMLILDKLSTEQYYQLADKYKDQYPDLERWQLEEKLYEDDVAFLFDYIKKHHRGWWD